MKNRPTTAGVNCLLCGCPRWTAVNELTCGELARAWPALGVNLPERALDVLAGRDGVQLMECTSCRFRFFDPSLAGDSSFYSALRSSSRSYYVAERDEFKWALESATRLGLQSVLDIGCGEGAFLDLARQRSFRTFGLELNSRAGDLCRQKGHAVYPCLLADLAKDPRKERFDLITAFQVLEHVGDPVGFLRHAAALLAPNGCVVIAVPNEHGVVRLCPFDPHQWPPHHISRWRMKDLRHLGTVCGLKVTKTGADRLHGGEVVYFWKLHNRLVSVMNKKKHPGPELVPVALSFLYRKSGMKFIFPRRGPSIYALYRKT